MPFDALDLPEPVRRGIADAGFTECTPIQRATLPLALAGKDIAGQAQTGTGKTAAFLIATFTRLLRADEGRKRRGRSPRVLVIAPTRELVVQIKDEAELLGRHCGYRIHAVYGGVDYQKQLEGIRAGVDILIGTPGRLIDYYRQKAYHLDRIEILVIDEADRMFDMGFIDDIRFMARRLPDPSKRQSFLYSATLSHRVLELAYEHMNRAERIAVSGEQITADNITQVVYHVGQEEKLPVLLGLLRREKPSRALVFVNTRSGAAFVASVLSDEGYRAGALAGDIDQRKRLRLLREFKEGSKDILVATDVASRGLHIEAVSHVFNYDLPQDPEDYVHRIGRTARAGATGKAVSLACERYVYSLDAIEAFVGYKIPHELPDEDLMVQPSRRPRSGAHRRDGGGRTARRGSEAGRGKTRGRSGSAAEPPKRESRDGGDARSKRKKSRAGRGRAESVAAGSAGRGQGGLGPDPAAPTQATGKGREDQAGAARKKKKKRRRRRGSARPSEE
ncbi:MAG: DEAD/DEAH box helicase [Deltaproteobacteria bacterium]|nr:MAG: DEAD/DEAH box helicase [Deltaproteobacteria bacterium]